IIQLKIPIKVVLAIGICTHKQINKHPLQPLKVMGEESNSSSEEEFKKTITSASEDEYWKSAPDTEDLCITKNLKKLKVKLSTSTIEPLAVTKTPKRKSKSPIVPTEAKKRLLNPMAPPKFSEVVQKTLWVVDVVIDDDKEVTMTKDEGELINEELTKALFASDKMGILDFDHCGHERNLYRTISRNT
ncbi:hypothetical protein Bhyg_18001, partial [Pseudolycoriella hygida]